jgi:hypothetical protein
VALCRQVIIAAAGIGTFQKRFFKVETRAAAGKSQSLTRGRSEHFKKVAMMGSYTTLI